MRTRLVLAAATLATGLALASPAAAQYYPPSHTGYGYGQPAHGYAAQAAQLRGEIAQVRQDIAYFGSRGMLTRLETTKLMRDASGLEYRIANLGRYGMNPAELGVAQRGLMALRQSITRDLRDRGNGRDDRRFQRYRWGGYQAAPPYGSAYGYRR